jgi:hypothetical protein
MRFSDKRNGAWTMHHDEAQQHFSELIIIICVYLWAFHASGVAHVWFPVSFLNIIHGWIIRDANIFVRHVRGKVRGEHALTAEQPTVTFVSR